MKISHRFTFALAVVFATAITVAGGVIHGRMSNRWGDPTRVLAAVEQLHQVPEQFGDWRLTGTSEMSEQVQNILRCSGYIERNYVNQKTGESVNVMVILGPFGPTSVHTPEICMSGQAYQQRDSRQHVSIAAKGEENQFWKCQFVSPDATARQLLVYYAWTPGNTPWTAPDDARFAFVGSPYLYKMQLSCSQPLSGSAQQGDACGHFLEQFLPMVKPRLVDSQAQ